MKVREHNVLKVGLRRHKFLSFEAGEWGIVLVHAVHGHAVGCGACCFSDGGSRKLIRNSMSVNSYEAN